MPPNMFASGDLSTAPETDRVRLVRTLVSGVARGTISADVAALHLRRAGLRADRDLLSIAARTRGVPAETPTHEHVVARLAHPAMPVADYHAQVRSARAERDRLRQAGNALIATVGLLALTGLVVAAVTAAWMWMPAGSGMVAVLAVATLTAWLWLRLSQANTRVRSDINTLARKETHL